MSKVEHKNYHGLFIYETCDYNNGNGLIYRNCVLLKDMLRSKTGDAIETIQVDFCIYGCNDNFTDEVIPGFNIIDTYPQ
jgi:hypothetical protein